MVLVNPPLRHHNIYRLTLKAELPAPLGVTTADAIMSVWYQQTQELRKVIRNKLLIAESKSCCLLFSEFHSSAGGGGLDAWQNVSADS